MFEVKICIET